MALDARWLALSVVGGVGLLVAALAALALGVGLIYGDRVLPRVYAGGVLLGGMTEAEAVEVLREAWQTITLQDGPRQWPADPAALGITLDAEATAARAYQQGRGQGGVLQGVLRRAEVPPALSLDAAQMRSGLAQMAPQFEQAPVNAGIRLVGGRVEPTPAEEGRTLDLEGTLARLAQDPTALADGVLELSMARVQPAITDASAMVAEAERLLSSPLDFRVYDPVTGDTAHWTVPPQQWAAWLAATPDPSRPLGLALALDEARLREYLNAQASAALDPSRYIDAVEAAASMQAAIGEGRAEGLVRVYHHDKTYVVQPGDSLISVAWDFGVPYPWIQQANPGVEHLWPGQTIIIPSPDNFLEFPVVPDKRIEVSISEQRVRVYEGGALRWDWPASTGIASSPTWPGVYQIISHEPNAYAANWNLYMPYFMGVYQPIPGADFTNGFHGFPTRGGSQLLWTNSLGTRVTYGCILLSSTNAEALYHWAEEGVVVEILP